MNKSSPMKQFALCVACAASLASGAASATPILAGTSYTYNLSTTSKLPGSSTLASITLTQVSFTRVDVRVALADNYYFAGTSGSDSPTFAFSLLDAYKQASLSYAGTDFDVMNYGSYNLTPNGLFTNGLRLRSTVDRSSGVQYSKAARFMSRIF